MIGSSLILKGNIIFLGNIIDIPYLMKPSVDLQYLPWLTRICVGWKGIPLLPPPKDKVSACPILLIYKQSLHKQLLPTTTTMSFTSTLYSVYSSCPDYITGHLFLPPPPPHSPVSSKYGWIFSHVWKVQEGNFPSWDRPPTFQSQARVSSSGGLIIVQKGNASEHGWLREL